MSRKRQKVEIYLTKVKYGLAFNSEDLGNVYGSNSGEYLEYCCGEKDLTGQSLLKTLSACILPINTEN